MEIFFFVLYSTLFHLPPFISTVSEDAGIEPRTVATSALAVRRSTHSVRSHHPFLKQAKMGTSAWSLVLPVQREIFLFSSSGLAESPSLASFHQSQSWRENSTPKKLWHEALKYNFGDVIKLPLKN